MLPDELGKLIKEDVDIFLKQGWKGLVNHCRPRSDFAALDISHPARRILKQYKHTGVPVVTKDRPWTKDRISEALSRGAHKSCNDYEVFLREEFASMRNKQQWIVLPYNVVKNLPGLRLTPPGVVPQRDRRPRFICDYSFSEVNKNTVPIAPMEAMQFGHALDRILRHILLADPRFGPTYLHKIDIADGFYRIAVKVDDIPKLAVIFPSNKGCEPLVAFPLVLPMGWSNSPPAFCAPTDTIADLSNQHLSQPLSPRPHKLDTLAMPLDRLVDTTATAAGTTVNEHSTSIAVPLPTSPDPHLPQFQQHTKPKSYVDVFVDDFISLAQGSHNRLCHVRQTLLHAIDTVFRPLDDKDSPHRQEPVSVKKLRKGDCSWDTCKLVLGWIIDTTASTITLPPHRLDRLAEILADIPPTQKRISTKKWHKVLGELRSMSIALPGSRGLFSHMQNALRLKDKGRIKLSHGVHTALDDFRWIQRSLAERPTRLQELVPLPPTVTGPHDASGIGAGGCLFPSPSAISRHPFNSAPVVWRIQWPESVKRELVTTLNPTGSITNSDLETAGALLQKEAAVQCFDVRERTVLSKTDNLCTLFWSRKGSTTTSSVPAHLLRLMSIHQRFHRYIPRWDYLPGKLNVIADDSSRLFNLTNAEFLHHFNTVYPQTKCYQLWIPSPGIISTVISALLRQSCKKESLLLAPNMPMLSGKNGQPSPVNWASTPFSRPSKTKYQSSKYLLSESDQAHSPSISKIKASADEVLRITYGQLAKRPLHWGPLTPGIRT